MWYAIVFGYRTSEEEWRRQTPQDVVVVGEVMLLCVVVLQIPLWIAKRAFRYRMVIPGEAVMPTSQERLQFQIKHLLIGTSVLAVALSPIRYILPHESVSLLPRNEIFLLVPLVIAANLLATLPCLWGGFVKLPAVLLALAWAAYCLIITGIELAIVSLLGPAGPPGEAFGIFFAMNLTQAAVVYSVMRVYRALGYRLQRVPRFAPPEPEVDDTEAAAVET
jgi:hypothetical protein